MSSVATMIETMSGMIGAAAGVSELFKKNSKDVKYFTYSLAIENYSSEDIELLEYKTSNGYLIYSDITILSQQPGLYEFKLKDEGNSVAKFFFKVPGRSDPVEVKIQYDSPRIMVEVAGEECKQAKGIVYPGSVNIGSQKWNFTTIDEEGGNIPIVINDITPQPPKNVGIEPLTVIATATALVSASTALVNMFEKDQSTKTFDYVLIIENFSKREFKLTSYEASNAYLLSPDLFIKPNESSQVGFVLRNTDDPSKLIITYTDIEHTEDNYIIKILYKSPSLSIEVNNNKIHHTDYPVPVKTESITNSKLKFVPIDDEGGKIPMEIYDKK